MGKRKTRCIDYKPEAKNKGRKQAFNVLSCMKSQSGKFLPLLSGEMTEMEIMSHIIKLEVF